MLGDVEFQPSCVALVEQLLHCDERRVVVSVVRMFGGPDKSHGGEGLMVFGQLDAGIQFQDGKAGLSSEVFRGLHETAAYALTLPVRPDGEFSNIQRASLWSRKDASEQISVLGRNEPPVRARFQPSWVQFLIQPSLYV